ncbi:hypothetical protein CDAR_409701, partial [Caerostris darwini]
LRKKQFPLPLTHSPIPNACAKVGGNTIIALPSEDGGTTYIPLRGGSSNNCYQPPCYNMGNNYKRRDVLVSIEDVSRWKNRVFNRSEKLKLKRLKIWFFYGGGNDASGTTSHTFTRKDLKNLAS